MVHSIRGTFSSGKNVPLWNLAIAPVHCRINETLNEHAASQPTILWKRPGPITGDFPAKLNGTVKTYRVYSTGILARTDTSLLEAYKGIDGKSTCQGVARFRLIRFHSEK
jgi:hypothetical protein